MTFSIRAWFIFSVVLASIGLIASWFLVLAAPTQTAPSVSRRASDTPRGPWNEGQTPIQEGETAIQEGQR